MRSGHFNTFSILEFAAKHPLIPGGKNPVRALRKRGTHFIIWVGDSTVTDKQLEKEEKILIAHYRPRGNILNKTNDKQELTPLSAKIIEALDTEIKNITSKK